MHVYTFEVVANKELPFKYVYAIFHSKIYFRLLQQSNKILKTLPNLYTHIIRCIYAIFAN